MRAIMRAALAVGLVAVAVAAFILWYVYGAWPVPAGFEFPRHSLWGGGPGGLFEGSLIERDGCVRTSSGETVVWPPGYYLAIDAGQPVVHGSGLQVRMGEQVRLGGGWYSRNQLDAVASGAAQTRCPESFFLTTGFVDQSTASPGSPSQPVAGPLTIAECGWPPNTPIAFQGWSTESDLGMMVSSPTGERLFWLVTAEPVELMTTRGVGIVRVACSVGQDGLQSWRVVADDWRPPTPS